MERELKDRVAFADRLAQFLEVRQFMGAASHRARQELTNKVLERERNVNY